MLPIGDDNTGRRIVPVVTWTLVGLNVLFFLVEMGGGEPFIVRWAFVPRRFLADPGGEFPTIFTAMFMHGGWLHLGGNMLYLWIFGDNIEDRFGHFKYLGFYLISGVAATLTQLYFSADSGIPNLGASGAVAGVLGGYLLLHPQGRVRVLWAYGVVPMPAILVIGLWFVLQVFSGIGSVTSTAPDAGGVAYMAHVGGFVAGFLLTFLLRGPTRTVTPWG